MSFTDFIDRWFLHIWTICLVVTCGSFVLVIWKAYASIEKAPQAEESRIYHPITIKDFAAADSQHWPASLHTHVEVEGFVTYTKKEIDGDMHVRICDAAGIKVMDRMHCIVAEGIPGFQFILKPHTSYPPQLGEYIRIDGISRFDAEKGHRWWEVHPIEQLEKLR